MTALVYSDLKFFLFMAPCLVRLSECSRDVLIETVKKATEPVWQEQWNDLAKHAHTHCFEFVNFTKRRIWANWSLQLNIRIM